ncbi:MAG: hypothetical protein Q8T04_02795, partial [Bacteroidota bacterium]|nr:hypothetical protein [Bacteroidota bacterium]
MRNSGSKIQRQFSELTTLLLQKRNAAGYWEGRLSSSALGVAVAITALHFYDGKANAPEILSGLNWLETNINFDGGFGDSPTSQSNVSTSLLCFAAVKACGHKENLLLKIGNYLRSQNIDVNSEQLIPAILDF